MNNYGVLSDLHLISSSLFFSWTISNELQIGVATCNGKVKG